MLNEKSTTNIYTSISTVDAPCGSGKTYTICEKIKEDIYKNNYLYVARSIKLLNQTKEALKDRGINAMIITSETHPNEVIKSIVSFLKNCDVSGEVLLITLHSYLDLPYFHNEDNWVKIIDEIPHVDSFHRLAIPYNHTLLTEYIELGEGINDTIFKIKAKDDKALRKFIERSDDDIDDVIKPLLKILASGIYDVFVDIRSWEKVIEENDITEGKSQKSKDKNTVFFLSMLNPNKFKDCVLMGANMENSLLFKWFSKYHQVDFSEATEITDSLRYTQHAENFSERLTINYLLEKDKPYSKHLRDKKYEGKNPKYLDKTLMDVIDRVVLKNLNGERFLLVANNDYDGALLKHETCTKIPVESHGINEYQDYTTIVYLPALNREPKHIQMLNSIGLSNDDINHSTQYEYLYQNLLRTNLRKPDSTEPVHVIVPSKYEAEYLALLVGGTSGKIGDINSYKKYKPLTQVERNKRSKAEKVKKSLFADRTLQNMYINIKSNHETAKHNLNIPKGTVTFHFSIFDSNVDDFYYTEYTRKELISKLRSLSNEQRDSKENNLLINASIYSGEDCNGYRKKENFITANMIILDFDNGECSINDFENIFSTEAKKGQKRSFIICNTFSRSEEKLNNFRVFMFFKEPAESISEYEAVYDSIEQRLSGIFKNSGLDRASRSPIQSYYAPCINREHPEMAYFKTHQCEKRDIDRYGIVPSNYLRTAIHPSEKNIIVPIDSNVSERKQLTPEQQEDAIRDIEHTVTSLSSGRHSQFFNAAVRLARLGLSIDEVEQILIRLESTIGKTAKKWAKNAINTLKTRNYQSLFV